MMRLSEQVSTYDAVDAALTETSGMPLAVHSKGTIGAGFQTLVATRLASALRGLGTRVERVTVRFEDLNGPKGGVDTSCRIHLVVSGEPALVVEARATGEAPAFRLAVPRLVAALKRQLNRRSSKVPRVSVRYLGEATDSA